MPNYNFKCLCNLTTSKKHNLKAESNTLFLPNLPASEVRCAKCPCATDATQTQLQPLNFKRLRYLHSASPERNIQSSMTWFPAGAGAQADRQIGLSLSSSLSSSRPLKQLHMSANIHMRHLTRTLQV